MYVKKLSTILILQRKKYLISVEKFIKYRDLKTNKACEQSRAYQTIKNGLKLIDTKLCFTLTVSDKIFCRQN